MNNKFSITHLLSKICIFALVLILVFILSCDRRKDSEESSKRIVSFTTNSAQTSVFQDSLLTVWAIVHDRQGFPVVDQEVRFKGQYPQINFTPAVAITDEAGFAYTTIKIPGEIIPSNADSQVALLYSYLGKKLQKELSITVIRNTNLYQVVDFLTTTGINTVYEDSSFTVFATVQDKSGFSVIGQPVSFRSDHSMVSFYPITAYSDSSGFVNARVIAARGTIPADADTLSTTLYAYIGTELQKELKVVVKRATMLEQIVQYMQFTNNSPISLNIAGTGGTDSSDLSVRLLDMSGKLVMTEKEVEFRIIDGPADARINGTKLVDSTVSINGIATVTINSGQLAGSIKIGATLIENPSITVMKSNIVIHSGAPETVELLSPSYNSGSSVGAGTWMIEIAALVKDTYGNPVANGTGVYFNLSEGQTDIPSELITVFGSSYIGNKTALGDSADGTAYTRIYYHGKLSNKKVRLNIEVGNSLTVSRELTLPMNQITLTAITDITNMIWRFPNWGAAPYHSVNTALSVLMTLKVVDGQNIPMENAILYFSIDRGFLLDPNQQVCPSDIYPVDFNNLKPTSASPSNPTGNPYIAPTGANGGQLKRYYSYPHYFPVDVPAPPATQTANVTITVEGTEATTLIPLTMEKYWGSPGIGE